MGIFSSIMNKLGFGHDDVAPAAEAAAAPAEAASAGAPAAAAPVAISVVDVMGQLEALAAKHPEKLNWKTSIVDLLKLLGIDSSLPARRELARELGYTASTDDTAAMNVWLHRQVMTKVAENGGTVPPELRA